MIFYKVNDTDRTLQVPSIIFDSDAGLAGLDQISVGNMWEITNVGNAIALWNPMQGVTTITVNFANGAIGKDIVTTVATEGRNSIGVKVHPIVTSEWREELNAAIQGAMFDYFVSNGDWTLNDNGLKGTSAPGFMEAIDAEESVFEDDNPVGVVDAAD